MMHFSLIQPVPSRRSTVTVVIPSYNYARFLPDAVRSATIQDGVDVDVIIVDDASTDGSQDVARSLAESDSRVRVLEHDHNLGHIATYNDGLASARGDYFVLLCADDVLAPGALARAVAVFDRYPNVGLVYGFAPWFSDTLPASHQRGRPSWSTWSGSAWARHACRNGGNLIVNPEAIIRTSLIRRLGGYDPDLPHTADMDLWLRASTHADIGRVNGIAQAFYRVHGQNMHLQQFAGVSTDLRKRAETIDRLYGDPSSASHPLGRLARRAIAMQALDAAADAMREASDPESVDELVAIALETWPACTKTLRWHFVDILRRKPGAARWMSGLHAPRDLRRKLAWRRWAYVGY